MRTGYLRTASYTGLLILTLAAMPQAMAAAQADPDTGLRVTIPFSFVVENTTLPMGRYQVQRAFEDAASGWEIRSLEPSGHSVGFLVQAVEPARTANRHTLADGLTFTNIGDQHYLNEVHLLDETFLVVPGRTRLRAETSDGSHETVHIEAAS